MMICKPLLFAALVAAAMTTTSAAAHDATPTFDRVSFRVSATKEVDNDTLVVVMYHQRNGQHPTSMADDVNRTIAWAVELARQSSGIKVQTLQYRQEPVYRNQSISSWRVRQSIRLESNDVTTLSRLVGALQERLSVASLRYTISPEVRRNVEDELITLALGRFGRRGKLIADELGRSDYRIVAMDVTTSGGSPAPVRMRAVSAMAESSSVTAPTLEPGVQSVTVQVSGTIELEVSR
jgi:predicted secreted protein